MTVGRSEFFLIELPFICCTQCDEQLRWVLSTRYEAFYGICCDKVYWAAPLRPIATRFEVQAHAYDTSNVFEIPIGNRKRM